MVDPGEQVSVTVRREFMEEALDSGSLGSTDKAVIEQKLKSFFDSGKELYKGYVDDPRNTDNAWMETVKFSSLSKIHILTKNCLDKNLKLLRKF